MMVSLIDVFNDTWMTQYDTKVHNLQNMEAMTRTIKLCAFRRLFSFEQVGLGCFFLPSQTISASQTTRLTLPALFHIPRVGRVQKSMTGVRQMIAVVITFRKCNINSLGRRSFCYRSSKKRYTIQITIWRQRELHTLRFDACLLSRCKDTQSSRHIPEKWKSLCKVNPQNNCYELGTEQASKVTFNLKTKVFTCSHSFIVNIINPRFKRASI